VTPPAPVDTATLVAAAEAPTAASAPPSPPEGVPVRIPAPSPVKTVTDPPPTQSALRVMPALLEKPAGTPQLAKAMSVKAIVKPSAPRRAKSLDDLISQIMASR
jgi:hypothetical protein